MIKAPDSLALADENYENNVGHNWYVEKKRRDYCYRQSIVHMYVEHHYFYGET
jgi:hypothetical protein